jgi:hypothetical protein
MRAQLEFAAVLSKIPEVLKVLVDMKDYIWLFVLGGTFLVSALDIFGHGYNFGIVNIVPLTFYYLLTLWCPLEMLPLSYGYAKAFSTWLISWGMLGMGLLGFINILRLVSFILVTFSFLSFLNTYMRKR